MWFILQMNKNLQKGLVYKLLGVGGSLPQLVFTAVCFLPRNNLLLFECNSTWRFLSCEENLWRGRCSSLFLWGKLFRQWIWPNSMLLFWVASRPSSVWRYLIFTVLLCQILSEILAPSFTKALWIQNKNTLFVPVHSLNRNQVVAERHRAKVAGRQAMIVGISFQWPLTTEQMLTLAVVSLNPGEAGVNNYREVVQPPKLKLNHVQITWKFNQSCLIPPCEVRTCLLRDIKNKICNKFLQSLGIVVLCQVLQPHQTV